MAKIFSIMKTDNNGCDIEFKNSRNEDYIRNEFKKLANIPNMKVLVEEQWIEHKITGVQFWIMVETI